MASEICLRKSAVSVRLPLVLALLVTFYAASAAAFRFPLPVGYSYIDTVSAQRYDNQPGTEIMMKALIDAPIGAVFDKYIQVFWEEGADFAVLAPGDGRGRVGLIRSVISLDFDEEIQAAGVPTDSLGDIASVTYKVTRPLPRTLDQLGFTRFVPVTANQTEIVWSFKLVLSPEYPDNDAFVVALEDTVYGVLLSIASAFPAPAVPTRYTLPSGYLYIDAASARTYERQPGSEVVVKQVVNGPIGHVYDLFIQNEWVNNSGSIVSALGEGRAHVGLVRTVTALGYTEQIVAAGLPTDSATAVATMTYQIIVGVEPGIDQLGFVRFIPLSKDTTEVVWTIKLVLTPQPTALVPNGDIFLSFLGQVVAGILASIASASQVARS